MFIGARRALLRSAPVVVGGYVADGILRSPNNMINNTTPSPYVASASTAFSASFDAWMAFDGEANPTDAFWAGTGPLPEFIKIDLGSPQHCERYKVTARNPTFHGWTDWVLAGSNDDSSYTTVDSRSGQSWSNGEQKTFVVSSPQQFRFWRWAISATASGAAAEAAQIEVYS